MPGIWSESTDLLHSLSCSYGRWSICKLWHSQRCLNTDAERAGCAVDDQNALHCSHYFQQATVARPSILAIFILILTIFPRLNSWCFSLLAFCISKISSWRSVVSFTSTISSEDVEVEAWDISGFFRLNLHVNNGEKMIFNCLCLNNAMWHVYVRVGTN